jgi:hypothetical protein
MRRSNKSLQALDFILNKFELSKFKEKFLSIICLTQIVADI